MAKMLKGHLIVAWYGSIHKSDGFFSDFIKNIRKMYD